MVTTNRIISSVHGKIKQILLVYETTTREKGIFVPFMLKLLAQLDASVTVFFWADDKKSAVELQGLLWETGRNSKIYNRENNFSGITTDDVKCKIVSDPFSYQWDHDSFWAQDAFLVLQAEAVDSDIHLIKLPDGYGRKNRHLASDLRTAGICNIVEEKDLKFCFSGGNVLVGADYLLIGEDDFRKTLRITSFRTGKIEEEEAKRELKNLLGIKRIIVLGIGEQLECKLPTLKHYNKEICELVFSSGMNSFQPFKHLDLFMSLLGKVDDLETIMVAKVHPINKNDERLKKCVKVLNEILRIIVRQLEREGFIVIRNRIPVYISQEGEESKCMFGFYNNGLIELYDEKKRAYIPEYGDLDQRFLEFDKRNRIIWEQLGFEVLQVGSLLPFSKKNGALRCLTKCLRRQRSFYI